MAKSHRENDDCGFGVPLFSGRGHLWISQAKSDTLQNQRACCYMCRRKLDYPCRAIVPPIEVKPQWLRVKKVAHKFRSTKGSGFPPSTPKLGRKIYALPLWFEVICLSTPENLQQTRKLGNKSENQWLSIMFPHAKIAMNLNVIPPWRRKDTLQRELSRNGKFHEVSVYYLFRWKLSHKFYGIPWWPGPKARRLGGAPRLTWLTEIIPRESKKDEKSPWNRPIATTLWLWLTVRHGIDGP